MKKILLILFLFTTSIGIYSQSGTDYLELGKVSLKNNKPQKAIDYWNKAFIFFTVQNNNEKAKESLHLLVNLYKNLQLYDKVILTNEKIISLIIEDNQEKADSFFAIANSYNHKDNFKNALLFFTKSLEINKSIHNKIGIVKSFYEIGNINFNIGKYEEAFSFYIQAINILKNKKLKDENKEFLQVMLYKQIAKIYMYKEDFDKAISFLENEFTLIYEQQNYAELADYFNTIGKIKILQNKFDIGIKFYQVSLSYLEKLNNKIAISRQLIKMGYCYLTHKKYNEAIASFTNSYIINSESNDTISLAYDMDNIATVYETMSEYKHALKYYNQSLIFNWEKGNTQGIINNSLKIGRIYYKLGIYNVAIEHFEEACKVVGNDPKYNDTNNLKRELNNEPSQILEELHRYLISAYIKDSNSQKAFAAACKNAVYSKEIKKLLDNKALNEDNIFNTIQGNNITIIGFFLSDGNNITRFIITKNTIKKNNILIKETNSTKLLSLFDNNNLASPLDISKKSFSNLDKIALIMNYFNYLSTIISLTKSQKHDYKYLIKIFKNFFFEDFITSQDNNKYKISEIKYISDRFFKKFPFKLLLK